MPMVEIDVPEQIAERIAALPRETVSRLLIEQIERIADENASAQSELHPKRVLPDLTAFWEKAENLVPDPPKRSLTPFEEGVKEKLRKQGFVFPPNKEI